MQHDTPAPATEHVHVDGRTVHVANRIVDDVVRCVQLTGRIVDAAAWIGRGVARIVHASPRSVDEVTRAVDNTVWYVDAAAWSVDEQQPTVAVSVRTVDDAAPNVCVSDLTRHVGGWPADGGDVPLIEGHHPRRPASEAPT